MKTIKLFALMSAIVVAVTFSALAQPNSVPGTPVEATPPAAKKDSANYVIRVQWKQGNHLQIVTTEGNFSLDTLLPEGVKINDSEVPISVSFKGELRTISSEKGQLKVFLGRTMPYVTSTYGAGKERASSYQQMQVGLSSTFTVTFGKPLIIQSDAKDEITILVKRMD